MPANIRIIHAHDFMKATPEGRLDFEESKKLLVDIALASAPLIDYDIILDTRNMKSVMSIADLWYLAAELNSSFNKVSSRPRRTAILCPKKRFDYAGFFALCSQNRGFHVNAFTSFEEAYEWLIANRN